jgi:stage V sporulation protein B
LSDFAIARSSVRSSLILFTSSITANLLLTAAVLVVARLLGPASYGAYTLALLPYTIFMLFTSIGVAPAITRFAAYHVSRGEIEEARRMTANGLKFILFTGIILTVISYITSPLVASVILHRPELTSNIQLSSLAILGQAVYMAAVNTFVGWNSMRGAGTTYILQGAAKLVLSPALVILGFGVFGAVLAHVSSYYVAAALALAGIYFFKLRGGGAGSSFRTTLADVKKQITYGFPIHMGVYLSNFASQNYILFILASVALNEVVGYFQAAVNITIVITIVATSLSLSLFQTFASLDGKKGDTAQAFVYAVKYVSYLATPIILFIAAASSPLVYLIYGRSYLPSANILSLMAISYMPMAIGFAIFQPFFNGIGKTRFTMFALLAGAASTVVLAPLLGLVYGAYGIIYSLLVSNWVSSILALYLAKRYLNMEINYASSYLALATAAVSYLAAFSLTYLSISMLPLLVLQIIVFFGLYLTIAPLVGVINSNDVLTLRSSTGRLGILSKIVSVILNYEIAIIRLSKHGNKISKIASNLREAT